jgi:hypothetical protein
VKQLSKLVKVRYVEDITKTERIGEARTGSHAYARATACMRASPWASAIRAAGWWRRWHPDTTMPTLPLPGPGPALSFAERELLLLKLRAPAGPDRTEILQISQIFRARIVDVSDDTVSLCVTGDPGKVRPLAR